MRIGGLFLSGTKILKALRTTKLGWVYLFCNNMMVEPISLPRLLVTKRERHFQGSCFQAKVFRKIKGLRRCSRLACEFPQKPWPHAHLYFPFQACIGKSLRVVQTATGVGG
jgi:hypothetical protein